MLIKVAGAFAALETDPARHKERRVVSEGKMKRVPVSFCNHLGSHQTVLLKKCILRRLVEPIKAWEELIKFYKLG